MRDFSCVTFSKTEAGAKIDNVKVIRREQEKKDDEEKGDWEE